MAKFLVKKSGPLKGEVEISGSKNAVLPIMSAALLTDETCSIYEAPALRDVEVMCKLLASIGSEIKTNKEENLIEITTHNILAEEAPYELVKKMRASILAMGPLLARTGKARIALPGAAPLAPGLITFILRFSGFRGYRTEGHGYVEACADKLVGSNVYLDFQAWELRKHHDGGIFS